MEVKEELRQKLLKEGFDCFIFYIPHIPETEICEKLNARYPGLYFLALRRMMHRSDNGRKWDEEDVLLKNYIFAYINKGKDIDFLKETGFLIVDGKDNNGKLLGQDYEFAKWILENKGLLGVSKARLDDGMVKIIGDPLLSMQDSIRKYSRRNRNCFVSLDIAGIKVETWLPFEWEIDPLI